jgi:hypothetical protein
MCGRYVEGSVVVIVAPFIVVDGMFSCELFIDKTNIYEKE